MLIDTNGFEIGDKAWCVWKKWGDYRVSHQTIYYITVKKSYSDNSVYVNFELDYSITIPVYNAFRTEQEAIDYCNRLNGATL